MSASMKPATEELWKSTQVCCAAEDKTILAVMDTFAPIVLSVKLLSPKYKNNL